MKRSFLFCLLFGFSVVVRATFQTDIEYGVAEGVSLKLDACVPDGPGPFPAVILVHGGGWSAGDKSGGPQKGYMAPMHEPLSAAGFAWFSINYRLAPQFHHPAAVEDVETAIRWVKKHAAEYHVDPQRIALSGESAGGHLVALAAVRADESTRLAAIVTFYGNFDLVAEMKRRGALSPSFIALLGRETVDEEMLKLMHDASSINYVKAGLPPFLLVHGTADQSVSYQQSVDMQAKLRAVNVPCELITIKDGPHGMLPWPALAPDFKNRVVAWLQATLPAPAAKPAELVRPKILGVAQLALYVHDLENSRKFYRDFLGYEEVFTQKNPDGSFRAALIKINDQQSIELLPEIEPATDRLHHLALETDNAEGMRLYLKSRGFTVPEHITESEINSASFAVEDPDGHSLEFHQHLPDSVMAREAGRHLPETRVSLHMIHGGVMVRHLDIAAKFYGDVLGCTEIWRGSGNGKVLSWVNMRVPDGTDWVEFMLYTSPPPPPLAKIGVNHHLCLVVPDVAKTLALLASRPLPPGAKLGSKVNTGTDHKRQISTYDPDGTRIEIMEPVPPDGQLAPSSDAPPPI